MCQDRRAAIDRLLSQRFPAFSRHMQSHHNPHTSITITLTHLPTHQFRPCYAHGLGERRDHPC